MGTAEIVGLFQFLSGAAFRRIEPAGDSGRLISQLLSNLPRFQWLLLKANHTYAKVLEIVPILAGIFPGFKPAYWPGSIPPRRF